MNARKLILCATVVALTGLAVASRAQDAPPASSAPHKYALLIGCTEYPALETDYQLLGPGNDVALTAKLLKKHFGYADDEIVTLVHANEPEARPTHGNIAREIKALIARVSPGDRVFLLIAGHGSQLIDDNPDDPLDDELDGLDEIFMPEDITSWNPDQPVQNSIRDDQMRVWLDALRAAGASVFFVADTCHSGSMARGGDEDNGFSRSRTIDPSIMNDPDQLDALLYGDPSDSEDQPQQPTGLAETMLESEKELPGLVALYAVDDDKEEHEHPMPPESRLDGPSYGRLTYAINWVLSRSKGPLNYRELSQQIQWHYQEWYWDERPSISASKDQLDYQVLGDNMWKDRSTIELSRDDELSRLSINEGLLDGATVGTIYAVYPPAGSKNADVPAGCVRVTYATPTTARVEVCEFGDIPMADPDALPAHGRCELAFVGMPSLKFSVGLALQYSGNDPAGLPAVAEALQQLAAAPNSLIRLADDDEEPEAFLLLADDGALFLRREFEMDEYEDSDLPGEPKRFPENAFGPFKLETEIDSPLVQALNAMAKAVNLRRLATGSQEMIVGEASDDSVELKLVVERWDPEAKEYKTLDGVKPIDARNGEKIRIRVFNEGSAPVDVSILYIDSEFGITSFLPIEDDVDLGTVHNRIRPHGEPAEVPFTIDATTSVGLEDVIIIATREPEGSPPRHFLVLQQKGVTRGDDSAFHGALGQLVGAAAFGRGDRGGSAAPDLANYAVNRVSWTVVPPDPDAEPQPVPDPSAP